MSTNRSKNVCLIVLGDIGHSPRMQYHAKSLLQHNYNVDLIGYVESEPLKEITRDPNAKIHKLIDFPDSNLPRWLQYGFKTVWQTLSLLIALFAIRRPQYVMCQNPPGIPTLFVCYFYSIIMRCKFIIDWHNYTWTILALNGAGELSTRRPIVRLAQWIERVFGRKSAANLCVTKAMQMDLEQNWNITATVLYDRPPQQFQPIALDKKHELYMRLAQKFPVFLAQNEVTPANVIESTAFTYKFGDGTVEYAPNRPGILVSSTSWTPDEDFGVLLEALECYEEAASLSSLNYPKLVCIITGKGPEKEKYLQIIGGKCWQMVRILTPWLETEDYPLVLAAADLGVCLHWSSSGLDLPMKVVDMFGSGLPVCAINYNCISELVKHEKNGFVFYDAQELAEQLLSWFDCFPKNISLVNIKEEFQKNLRRFQAVRWQENWNANALPIFK